MGKTVFPHPTPSFPIWGCRSAVRAIKVQSSLYRFLLITTALQLPLPTSRMTRHGKNCTAGAVYTYHEKKKDTGTGLGAG